MKNDYIARQTVDVNAPPEVVWKALTDPDLMRQYLFGTQTITDWKVGSPIRWKGEWQGMQYEDKGRILEIEPAKLLRYTYWSSLSGKEDKPENYKKVSFELYGENG